MITFITPFMQRIRANNIGPFTFDGTNSYLIMGKDECILIDPGPRENISNKEICDAIGDKRLSHIICTHRHADHIAAVNYFKEKFGAKIVAYKLKDDFDPDLLPKNINPANITKNDQTPPAQEQSAQEQEDLEHNIFNIKIDHYCEDKECFELKAENDEIISLRIYHTAGHCYDHICIGVNNQYLITGDHIMGWSTSIIIPPDGDLGDYFNSLRKCFKLPYGKYLPGHGEIIEEPKELVKKYYVHRKKRLRQLKKFISIRNKENTQSFCAKDAVSFIYPNIQSNLVKAATIMVYANLLYLEKLSYIKNISEENRYSDKFIKA